MRGITVTPESIKATFWSHVRKSRKCWEYDTKRTRNPKYPYNLPYRRIYMGGGQSNYIYVHRYSWLLHRGSIPVGLLVLHKCDNPACVRPTHLYLGTHHDNNQDALRRGRWRGPAIYHNALKTHCPKGHPYTPENTKPAQGNPRWRRCRTCHNAWYHKNKVISQ